MVINLKRNNKNQLRLPKENGTAPARLLIGIQSLHLILMINMVTNRLIAKHLLLALAQAISISPNSLPRFAEIAARSYRLSLLQRKTLRLQ